MNPKIKPDTVVVKILEFKRDWKLKEPDGSIRNAKCAAVGVSWKNFSACASPSNTVNGRYNMSLDRYLLYLKAAGMEDCEDKYWDASANPRDSIPSRTRNSAKSKLSHSKVKSNNTSTEILSKSSETSDCSTPDLPDYPEDSSTKNSQVVMFDLPWKSGKVNTTSTTSSTSSTPLNRPKNISSSKKPEHAAPGEVKVVKQTNNTKPRTTAWINSIVKKMNMFRLHLSVYFCALHISVRDAEYATSISNLSDIIEGKSDIQLREYIILSEYVMNVYTNCNNAGAIAMFKQLADLFDDIYISTSYWSST